jgi:carbon-monoxide dehydrogenase medium subunit
MKPAPFEYAAPDTLEEAISLLEQNEGDAKVLSGGQSLMPLLNMRLARPEVLVDLARIPGLDYLREEDGELVVGAMTRQRTVELDPIVREKYPLVYEATLNVAHPQNRNQGTFGGSLAHADPSAEYPALAVALGAQLKAVGPDGERTIDADDFFVTYLTTDLEPAEVLTEVRLPALPQGAAWSFTELARRHGDYALAGVASYFTCEGGKCASARIVLFGVGATPVRAAKAERAMIGQAPSASLFESVGKAVLDDVEEPQSDVHASAAQRRALAGVLTQRGLQDAARRAGIAL